MLESLGEFEEIMFNFHSDRKVPRGEGSEIALKIIIIFLSNLGTIHEGLGSIL